MATQANAAQARNAMSARPITGPMTQPGQANRVTGRVPPAAAPQQVPPARPTGYKYTNTVRNTSQQPAQPATPHNAVHVQGQEPLTTQMLAEASPREQKQMLGERLFPLIYCMHAELAGKITGMLLEIDNSELLHMLEHDESLKAKVEEAVAVLQAHQAKEEMARVPAPPTAAPALAPVVTTAPAQPTGQRTLAEIVSGKKE